MHPASNMVYLWVYMLHVSEIVSMESMVHSLNKLGLSPEYIEPLVQSICLSANL